jgi:hypothetical protein
VWSLVCKMSVGKEYNRSPTNYDQCEPGLNTVKKEISQIVIKIK